MLLMHVLSLSTANQPHVDQRSHGDLEPVTDRTDMVFPLLKHLEFTSVNFNAVDGSIPAHQIFARALSARVPFSGVPRKLVLTRCQLGGD